MKYCFILTLFVVLMSCKKDDDSPTENGNRSCSEIFEIIRGDYNYSHHQNGNCNAPGEGGEEFYPIISIWYTTRLNTAFPRRFFFKDELFNTIAGFHYDISLDCNTIRGNSNDFGNFENLGVIEVEIIEFDESSITFRSNLCGNAVTYVKR